MSDCEISIETDHSDQSVRAGETLTGRVVVEVDEDVSCGGLVLEFFWRTHGSGDMNKGNSRTRTLFEGQWRKGEAHEYPFEFEVPEHPLSFHGTHVNVDWYLKASADVAWVFDPEVEQDVIVKENPDTPPREPSEEGMSDAEEQTGVQGTDYISLGGTGLFGAVFFGLGLFTLYAHFYGDFDDNGWVALLMGSIFTLVGGGIIAGAFRNYVASMSFDRLRVDLDPLVVTPGNTTRCEVKFTPDSEVTLNGIELTLKGQERAVHHHGTDSTTYRTVLSASSYSLPDAQGKFYRGSTRSFSTELSVPEDAPPTFHAEDNDVFWTCTVHIDIDGWPDWSKRFPIYVVR